MPKRPSNAAGAAKRSRRFHHPPLEDTVGFLLADAARTMTRIVSARMGEHGIGLGVLHFLRILWEEDGLTQSELAERARVRRPSAAGALYELERRGLVRRVADRDDRRKVRVLLTAEGRGLYNVLMPEVAISHEMLLAHFSPTEHELLKSMLRRIRENLTAADTNEPDSDT